MPEVHHELVFFSGHVQGVGFRYTCLQVSKEFEVTGFVSNLADGRVHLEAQGEKCQIEAFIKCIEERMHGHIRKTERSSRKQPQYLRGFVIR